MSREFPNNDTNPETNAFKWLYYSVKELGGILLPRFWKLIVLLSALSLLGRLSGIACFKILDMLFSLPEQVVANSHNMPITEMHTFHFQFNIFGQTLAPGNIMLIGLALISAFFVFSPSGITTDDKKKKGIRWLFLIPAQKPRDYWG